MADHPMNSPRLWLELAGESLTKPRAAARRILAMPVSAGALAQLAIVITCFGIILAYVAMRLSHGAIDEVSARLLGMPVLAAALEFGVMAVIGWLTYRIGALFGGKGRLWDALVLVVWLNAILLLIQTAQIAALAVLPPLAAVLAILGLLWAIWAYANFVTELHEFDNPMLVLGGVVLTAIVLFIGIAMVFAVLGLTPGGVR